MFGQVAAITMMNLRNVPARYGISSVIVVGIAGVVAVLVSLFSMAAGFRAVLLDTAHADRAIVMRAGTTNEMNGNITPDQRAVIAAMEGVEQASGELYVVAAIEKLGTDVTANVVVRGVETASFDIRDEVVITNGRLFETGKAEIIVGQSAVGQFANLDLGDALAVRGQSWTVVGHFASAGKVYESEIWADLAIVQAAFRRGPTTSNMRLQLSSADAIAPLNERLDADPRFDLVVRSEAEHYADQSESQARLIEGFGTVVALIMAIGAIFAALNTMYSAVSARTVEIATLRALGFGNLPVVVSVLIEALFLALIGGVLGGVLVWLAFDGYSASTLNNASFSQVAFEFSVTPALLTTGLTLALVLGFVGGLLPALRAARMPVTVALRGE